MGREQEVRHLAPPLARYLGSLDTRNRYLRRYQNIQVVQQNEREGYYVFEADGRKQNDPLRRKLRAEVFLAKSGKPYYARFRNYGRYDTGIIDLVEYKDFETVVQGRIVRFCSENEFIYSVRSHQRKNRGGIHCIYRTNGTLERVELFTSKGRMVSCEKFSGSDEVEIKHGQFLGREFPLSGCMSSLQGEAVIDGSVLKFKATNEADNTVFNARVDKVINPAICQKEMDMPDVSWVNIFKQLPFQLEIVTINSDSEKQDDDPTIDPI